nr:pentapeptide repeat-containing protein [uncultured Draconibacterium sp.]
MKNSNTYFFIVAATLTLAVILVLDWSDGKFSYHDILVEFHGLIFDLIVFGIILTIYESVKSKREKIVRYKEEIDDYRFLNTEESRHRLNGIIRRLFQLDKSKISLKHCSIYNFPTNENMVNWEFDCAKLYNTEFNNIKLNGSRFYLSEFYLTFFFYSNLTNCDFSSAIFWEVNFIGCTFENTEIIYSYTNDKNWFENLIKNGNIGVKDLATKYELTNDTIEINNKQFYQVIRKDCKIKRARTPDEILSENLEKFNNQTLSELYSLVKPTHNKE